IVALFAGWVAARATRPRLAGRPATSAGGGSRRLATGGRPPGRPPLAAPLHTSAPARWRAARWRADRPCALALSRAAGIVFPVCPVAPLTVIMSSSSWFDRCAVAVPDVQAAASAVAQMGGDDVPSGLPTMT